MIRVLIVDDHPIVRNGLRGAFADLPDIEVVGEAANREAAEELFISEASIKTHLQHVHDKLDVRDRAAAVGEGYRRGLLR